MSTRTFCCEIEMIGGPVDGHVGAVPFPPQPFLGIQTGKPPRRRTLMGSLLKFLRRDHCGLVRVAIYEYCEQDGHPWYQYLMTQSMPAEAVEALSDWTEI